MVLTLRRIAVFLLSLIPFFYLLQAVVRLQAGEWDILGPEPGRAIVFFTGTWAFNFLLLTLVITPAKDMLKQKWLVIHRRMIGLFAFFYASLHLLAYFAFLLEWQWPELGKEIVERPYLLVGMFAWLMLVPLTITSTKNWQRRLKRNWKKLHKLVYFIGLLAALHYLLQIRSSWFEPVLYILLLLLILAPRFMPSRIKQ
ncbi:sulfite oxidase heme-binding subunit YedZ [Bacterioplanoides sp. SCSIO 12839]|uniref:sulfite oxidase heme-binding subunit YedZ n=1 Tax=Bacterioplanoides sp. SCSIO 12839 TaxID=2829569 RepID=UPI0021084014|nr:protein-methionine-sulfoxide reductase heme-binding subunit MsrQ [Bacterioplanoides sp. SCSIO 12839]UTW48709.1 sulfoxide reductase heme-binding subunit YedZ [Bacterioplanoides sp. SCSIO 12839]